MTNFKKKIILNDNGIINYSFYPSRLGYEEDIYISRAFIKDDVVKNISFSKNQDISFLGTTNKEEEILEFVFNIFDPFYSCFLKFLGTDKIFIIEDDDTAGLRNKYLERLDKLVKKNGLEIFWSQELKGVEQDINNDLILKCNEIYKKIYSRNLEKMITQGVVEGGFFLSKVNDLQYVCIGPNTEDVHSPNERVSITSLKNTYEYLQELLISF